MRVEGLIVGVQGLRIRVEDFGFGVWDFSCLGFRVQSIAIEV